jgi:two-component system, NarL family, response regulator LiaR
LIDAIAVAQSGAMYLDPLVRNVVIQLRPSPQINVALSDRELEVLQLLVKGQSNPTIAEALYLSESTVKAHLRNIMNKLGVNDRVQVAVVALRSGLVAWDKT